MKTPCDIIRDLLPLYAEDMTSQASNELVEAHLGECESCTNYLEELRKPAKAAAEVPIRNLKNLKKAISRRNLLTALTAVLLLCSIALGAFTFLNTNVSLTAEQAIDSVVQMEDGTVRVYWKNIVSGTGTIIQDTSPNNMGIVSQTKLKKLLFPPKEKTFTVVSLAGQKMTYSFQDYLDGKIPAMQGGEELYDEYIRFYTESPSKDINIWYENHRDGTPELLLWDAGAEYPPEGFSFEPSLGYLPAYYCIGAALLALLFGLLARYFREKRAGKWMRIIALFWGCSCLATLCNTGGDFVELTYGVPMAVTRSGEAFVPFFLTGLCSLKLWDLKRQDIL